MYVLEIVLPHQEKAPSAQSGAGYSEDGRNLRAGEVSWTSPINKAKTVPGLWKRSGAVHNFQLEPAQAEICVSFASQAGSSGSAGVAGAAEISVRNDLLNQCGIAKLPFRFLE